MIYYFKDNTARKRFDGFNNGIELFGKIKSFEMNPEEAKKLHVFKLNLNEISKERYKPKEQIRALENIKLLYESRKAVIKLFNGYSSIVSEAKNKLIHRECLKILTPKQILQKITNSSFTSKRR